MTVWETPKIDNRSAEAIFAHLVEQLEERKLATGGEDPLTAALLRVFARYCEIIIHRLNQAPDKNYLAFLNFLQVSRIPPIPAWVPLTFRPVKQLPLTAMPVEVPAHTRVAAPAGDGEPVVFETVRSLTLTNAQLIKVFALDPREDRYADRSALVSPEGSPGEVPFAGELPIRHEFYIGYEPSFGNKDLTQLRLKFDIDGHPSYRSTGQLLEWRIPAAPKDLVLTPSQDTTEQLTRSGEIVFEDLPAWPAHTVFGRNTHWLACRLLRLLKGLSQGKSAEGLPRIRALAISALYKAEQAAIEQASCNNLPLDIGKDFFPLGERPRFGDVFYLRCGAFCRPQADVALKIKLTNPASAGEKSPIRPVNRAGGAQLQWEIWDGKRWIRLDCRDETRSLTEDGTVHFSVPDAAVPASVNGLEGAWIRARLIAGDYGQEEGFEFLGPDQAGGGLRHRSATLAPPAIQSMAVTWSVTTGPRPAETIITHNNLAFQEVDLGKMDYFLPFRPADHASKSCYLGFNAPERALAGRAMDLYFHMGNPAGRSFARSGQHRHLPTLTWQYWNGRHWRDCRVDDGTGCLTMPGIISLHLPEDISPWRECSLIPERELCWIRVLWGAGEYEGLPRLRRILLNTVPATHSITLENELLGSSNGTPRQTFRSARIPILGDLQLEIREPDLPGEQALRTIRQEEGEDAVRVTRNARGVVEEVWIRWHEVADFLSSNGDERHFVVNRLTGEIRFGDGIRGLIPPMGSNNVRLRQYQTGGGTRANQPADSITQLRTAVPFVDSVTNLEPASGGQDVEDWDSLRERGPRWLRHRNRAVTIEDYEDLAIQASAAVARAKCYPLRDLTEDSSSAAYRPGVVSVVIVPSSTDPVPKPGLDLLRQVRRFLDRYRAPAADLIVFGPEYAPVGIEAEIVPAAGYAASGLLADCQRRLNEYLHPLTGGPHGEGWPFGQLPHRSDFYPLLEALPGLEYVRSLQVITGEERPGLLASGVFLICSGQHKIRLEP